MVIVELKGGIGNQLFQYATGIALAEFHKTSLKVDIRNLDKPDIVLGTYRTYKLKYLDNPPVIATESELENIPQQNSLLSSLVNKINPIKNQVVFKEKSFGYSASIFKTRPDVYLKGNWQSEKYFKQYEATIQQKLSFDDFHISEHTRSLLKRIKETNSIAVHIRRGDYVSNKIANDVLGTLPIKYYQSAFEIIRSKTNAELESFIFSDDMLWTKEKLSFLKNKTFVELEDKERDIAEFHLMSKCKHNIIANSSFSWWAAWLNKNPDKIAIAPKRWFNKGPQDTQDLVPENWLRI